MGRVRVQVMGPVRIDAVPSGLSAAASSVIAFVALHGPGRVGRERIAYSLWPDRPEDRARRALSDALYRLRASCDDAAPWLGSDAESVWFDDVEVDLWEFRSRATTDGPSAITALALHTGPLADGIDDEWLDLPRLAAHEAVVGLAERLAGALDPAARLPISERWVEIDPLSPAAHRCVVETLLALDRTDAARRAVERFEQLLNDLGVDPGPEVSRWRRTILDAERPDPTVPLVGRGAERGRLVRLLDEAVEGGSRTGFVLGPPGIGKTRLLDELAEAARWRGVAVVRVGCQEFEPPAPFAPLDAAVAAAFDELRTLRARVELPADVRRALGRRTPALAEAGPTDVGTDAALTTVLRWLARSEPLLVLLDDVQWAGDEMWPLLVRCTTELADVPVALIGAARDGEHLPARARSAIGELDAVGSPVVRLSPLSPTDLSELLRAHGVVGTDPAALHERSAGNPLVALVLAGESDSERLDAVVARRIQHLDADALGVLRLAAVAGRTVDLDLLLAAAPADVVASGITAAERSRLLVRRSGDVGFEHDLVRDAVLATIDPDSLRDLHRRVLTALSAVRPDEVLRLLGHAEGAGDAGSAATYALAAGADALDQSAYRTAATRFGRVLELADLLDDTRLRHLALAGRIRAFDRLAERTAQRADVDALAELAATCGDPTIELDALRHEADLRFAVGEYTATLAAAERALGGPVEHAATDGPPAAELMRIASVALRELGRYDESSRVGRRAADAFAREGDEFGVATMTDVLGGIAWRSGDPALAARLHQEAADRFAALGALGAQARALNNVGSAMWALGDDRGAEAVHERALTICRALEDRRGEGDNLDNLGGVAFVRGEIESAIDLYRRALEIRRATDDPWGVSISLSNLGDAERVRGEAAAALDRYDESLAVNRAAGVVRNESTTLLARGLALLDLGRLDEARTSLESAAAMLDELGDRANLLQGWCGLLDLAVAADDHPAIHAFIAKLAAEIAPTDRPLLREEVEVCLAEALASTGDDQAARAHAAQALGAMDDALASLTPLDRARRLATLPVHARADRLVDRFGRRTRVRLARADAPLGVTLGPAHRVDVVWTTERPDDELVDDRAERRRTVLRRLAAEATSAGALPTDDDLAAACGVTRRTILRDIDALRLDGVEIATRRRIG